MIRLNLTPFPKLTTPRLLLRELGVNDAEEIFRLRADAHVNALIDRKTATSVDEAYQFIDMITGLQKNDKVILWVITLAGQPKLIGTVLYWNIIKDRNEAEVGYELLPEYHGKGIMQEALEKVVEYGFETMGIETIKADPNVKNLSSIKLLQKCGFIRTGLRITGI